MSRTLRLSIKIAAIISSCHAMDQQSDPKLELIERIECDHNGVKYQLAKFKHLVSTKYSYNITLPLNVLMHVGSISCEILKSSKQYCDQSKTLSTIKTTQHIFEAFKRCAEENKQDSRIQTRQQKKRRKERIANLEKGSECHAS